MFYRKCLIPPPSSRMEVGPNILPDKGKGWRLCLTSGNIFVVQTLDTQRSEAADHVKVGILILQLKTQLQKKFFCNSLKLKSSMKENFFVLSSSLVCLLRLSVLTGELFVKSNVSNTELWTKREIPALLLAALDLLTDIQTNSTQTHWLATVPSLELILRGQWKLVDQFLVRSLAAETCPH